MINKKYNLTKKKIKSKSSKSKQSKSKHKRTNNINANIPLEKIELLFLFNVIIDTFLLLLHNKTPKKEIKLHILNIFKDLRHNNKIINKSTKDEYLETLFNKLYKETKLLDLYIKKEQKYIQQQLNIQHHQNDKHNQHNQYNHHNQTKYLNEHNGGFYFANIEDKGDQPVTGNDISQLLTEIQDFFYNAQYTREGEFLIGPNRILSLLRGDTSIMESYLKYVIIPQYFTFRPPFFNWNNIKEWIYGRRWEDIPDYLLAYKSYNKLHDEYLISKGEKSPDALNKGLYTGFFDKLANTLDQRIQQFQRYRNYATLRQPLIGIPL